MTLLNQEHITFHVGMPKSASTTIQRYLCQAAPNAYLGHENNTLLSQDFLQVVRGVELDLKSLSKRVNDFMQKRSWIFSSEFAVSYWTPLSSAYPQDVAIIAERLYTMAPHANIVLVLRNPLKMLESLFAQLLFNESFALSPGKISFVEWIDKNIQLHEKGWLSAFDLLNYPRILRAYGKFENVQIYFFEEVSKDFAYFMNNDLIPSSKIEVDFKFQEEISNKRHTSGSISAKRHMSKLLKKTKQYLPVLAASIPKNSRLKFQFYWQRMADKLPGGLIKPKYRTDQMTWLQSYFSACYSDLPYKIQEKAKAMGYPI